MHALTRLARFGGASSSQTSHGLPGTRPARGYVTRPSSSSVDQVSWSTQTTTSSACAALPLMPAKVTACIQSGLRVCFFRRIFCVSAPGREPPCLAVKRPAHPYKTAVEI